MLEAYPDKLIPQKNGDVTGIPPASLPDLIQHYTSERLVSLPGLIAPNNAYELLMATQAVPARRVWCGLERVTWCEQNFEPGHLAYELFEREQAVGLVTTLTGLSERRGLSVWTSAYGAGEYINPHRDSSGSIQLLVCLQAPSDPVQGGELIVDGTRMFLRPGDAIAFEATTLEHHTTPLIATVDEPDPRRVVLVGRYFLE